MSARSCLVIVLAAGEGTRMNSSKSKVLHPVAGLPMLGHVIGAAGAAGAERVAIVVGPDADDVRRHVATHNLSAETFIQPERRGTAHAVLAARAAIEKGADDILVLYGDTPLIAPATIIKLREALAAGAEVVVLGFRASNPAGYGRLVTEGERLVAIREEKDSSEVERDITLCNAGAMALSGKAALSILESIGSDNAKGEFYLTDAVEVANGKGVSVGFVEAEEDEARGVNTRAELAAVEAIWQRRRRLQAMAAGVTLIDPDTVYFSHDTELGRDITIEPGVVFGPGVSVAEGSIIHAYSHIEGARIGSGVSVGPFARLRPGAALSDGSKVGNFCEVKNSEIGASAKVNHLTYIGDATVGAKTNIGAGTITCNYDGQAKYRTEIGSGSFIGSNSALVAPVKIGDDAYVASGSVIVEDVEDGALAVARGRQVTKPGWVAKFRSRQ